MNVGYNDEINFNNDTFSKLCGQCNIQHSGYFVKTK